MMKIFLVGEMKKMQVYVETRQEMRLQVVGNLLTSA
jgi:hypothetical protein